MALEDFSDFLMRKIGEKYRDGIDGLLERFMTVFDQLAQINKIALTLHRSVTESEKKLKRS